MSPLRKKWLEILLNRIPRHPSPKIELEQYATPSTLAATLLWIAQEHFQDISGKKVLDLGCGTGRLGIGAALLGGIVVMLDLDFSAVSEAKSAAIRLGVYERVDLLVADVRLIPLREGILFDTVVENPPFGVHARGSDITFLSRAVMLAGTVYSIHKSSSVDFVKSYLEKMCGDIRVQVLFEERMCLPPEYPFHRKRRHCFNVAVIRVVKL
ncbi:METTL5 family protein [Thermofilum pendens]|uniref:Methyltransferase-like protein 5 n=1 Tax=Thermofilum pendens (strain DSM 2475 / Hrk 5) TaxID=368408 RepID=A1RXJ6_THEPD|nr:METTL5 family protein [Thermofilum pendens]ABL77926.1 methyltransferase [Thermofilum pendens Hrk 5]